MKKVIFYVMYVIFSLVWPIIFFSISIRINLYISLLLLVICCFIVKKYWGKKQFFYILPLVWPIIFFFLWSKVINYAHLHFIGSDIFMVSAIFPLIIYSFFAKKYLSKKQLFFTTIISVIVWLIICLVIYITSRVD